MAQPDSARTSSSPSSGGAAGERSSTSAAGQGGEQRDSTLAGRVRARAAATLESQKDRATEGLGSVAQAVRSTEEGLRSQHHESIADYVAQVADQIDRASRQLREKRVNELLDDAQRFARRHPAAFAGAAFALGVVTSRFLKSSSDRGENGHGEYAAGTFERSRYGADYRSSAYGSPDVRSTAPPFTTTPTPAATPSSAAGAATGGGSSTTTASLDPKTSASPGAGGPRSRRAGSETERS